jgi:hypothetical protein
LQNDIIHGSREGPVMGSTIFLSSYAESLNIKGQQVPLDTVGKGKGKVMEGAATTSSKVSRGRRQTLVGLHWVPPPQGWIKVSADAGFYAERGLHDEERLQGMEKVGSGSSTTALSSRRHGPICRQPTAESN